MPTLQENKKWFVSGQIEQLVTILFPIVKYMKPQLTHIFPVFDFFINPQIVLIMSLQNDIL